MELEGSPAWPTSMNLCDYMYENPDAIIPICHDEEHLPSSCRVDIYDNDQSIHAHEEFLHGESYRN
jgi:hypothetical protein